MKNIKFTLPTSLNYFSSLVCSDDHFALLEATISVAQVVYPKIDVQDVLVQVDTLQDALQKKIYGTTSPLQCLKKLNQFFFAEVRFDASLNNYYRPQHSMIHHVLKTRHGTPHSLGVLWLELAKNIGLDATGVSFLDHFLLRVYLPHQQVVVDPLSGKILGPKELTQQWQQVQQLQELQKSQQCSELHPHGIKDALPVLNACLRVNTPREMLDRTLRTLRELYRTSQDWEYVIGLQDRLVVLHPTRWEEYRDRGLLLALYGEEHRARTDLETYLAHVSNAEDASVIKQHLSLLRKRLV